MKTLGFYHCSIFCHFSSKSQIDKTCNVAYCWPHKPGNGFKSTRQYTVFIISTAFNQSRTV